MLSNASPPAHTTNTMISEMWTRTPATAWRPTEETATERSTACFWRYRMSSSRPPTPAGASWPANEEATWHSTRGAARNRRGTAPARLIALPTNVSAQVITRTGNHHQSAASTWLTTAERSASSGSTKYVTAATTATTSTALRSTRSSSAKWTWSTPAWRCTSCCSDSRSPFLAFSAVWVAPLKACSWRRGSASATAAGPSTSTATRTGRSGPATTAIAARIWATSCRAGVGRRPARRSRSR